jgi:hypothetical protein
MNKNSVDFAVGDTVAIAEHRRAPTLYPTSYYTVEASGGWVIESIERDGYIGAHKAWMYKFVDGEFEYRYDFADFAYLTLEKKGDGTFIPGVHLPLSPRLILRGRIEKVRDRFVNTPVPKHEGFCNAATWMAHMLLAQESCTRGHVEQMRRKDGTVNPDKIKKLFSDLRLKLEGWVTEPHIEIPEDLRGVVLPGRESRLGVNWQELAHEFADASCVST